MAVSSSTIRILARAGAGAAPVMSAPSLRKHLVLAQFQGEGAALVDRARHLDVPAVDLGDVPREGQPQPGPLDLAGEVVLGAIELLEDLTLLPFGNPNAAVDHFHGNVVQGLPH